MRISPSAPVRRRPSLHHDDEIADRDLLVERRDHDGDLGVGHVVLRDEEADFVAHGVAADCVNATRIP